jgi:predicted alpha/beta-fold hydrolase
VALSLSSRFPEVPLVAVGYSLGGNALLNWLGESGDRNPLSAAVAVSIPFRLELATERLNHGFSRLYQRHLLSSLKRRYREKFRHRSDAPYPLDRLRALRDFRDFDHFITAPLNGYQSAEQYYATAGSRSHLAGISIPTLIVHAWDDPFMTPEVLPTEAELSPQVTLEVSPSGGHVGFVSGSLWRPRYWLEQRIPAFIEQRLASASYPS